MPELIKKGTIEDLPVFDRFPSPDKNQGYPLIFEIARITTKPIIDTNPPHKIQYHGGVIGRNPKCSEIYFAPQTMEISGRVYAYPEGITPIRKVIIDSYVIPEENAFREIV